MALASSTPFASFDITDGAQTRDISPVLADAIFYDLHLLGALNVDFGSPVEDTKHWWNEDLLNSDTVTTAASAASNGTSISLSSGHGARVHVGDLFYDTTAGSTEIGQVTAISTDTLTVTRAYNSTTAASIASSATLAVIRAEQEGSDIGSDKSLSPRVRSNFTQIFSSYDILISGSQLARKMATTQMQDFLARQLANRATELKINMSRAFLYSEISSSAGSDSAYRTMAGIRGQINAATGVTNSTSAALSYANLNTYNKSVVDLGVFPDTLVIGTDLVGSVAGYDSSNRRMLESDRVAGYTVQEVMLNQGNAVRVVVDSRVKTGDAFLLSSERIRAFPLQGRGMFVIAATDFADAKKRRVLGEWTLEVRNPEAQAYLSNKT
jgi:hypothetical protein